MFATTSSAMASSSMFEHIVEAPPDPILGTALAYKADTNPNKVNLGVGAYRTEEGATYVFPVVAKVDKELAAQTLDKEYLPIDGLPGLKKVTQKLLFGECAAYRGDRICSIQALSGTGALRVGAEFMNRHLPQDWGRTVYLSDPTWGNHKQIFLAAGFAVKTYPYWDQARRCVDMDAMLHTLKFAPKHSIIVLHGCAHNPTGLDPTKDEWQQIVQVIKDNNLIPFIDTAYQGYASGDLDEDAYSLRLFESSGLEFFVAQSFAKNFGLYGERVGMFHIVASSAERAKVVLSQVKPVVRAMYSNPPVHGGRIVERILSDPTLFAEWQQQLKDVAARIHRVRSDLRGGLEAKGTPGSWEHITRQIGMFSYTGLSVAQSERMIDQWHIYMLKNGRISLAGLNHKNIPYVVGAIDDCVRNAPGDSKL
ncbi:unnamed protein product [Vitrella brassicaformis CCMP3155]|uniref:Aspartate aminotransferase n=1 Tax=Vitrella brassicaformis (strain CCMP3155) TaxID=1169540 RepID=A0A0G4GRS7_VITBC|nr:unnamed protein product [Vitrella brassicaformis CCMP3155]|eukprot:CEM33330.1 unnamed protein product [Vitrella brassicaformis CCMP3155]